MNDLVSGLANDGDIAAEQVQESVNTSFERLWKGFMNARVLLAATLLVLHVTLLYLGRFQPPWFLLMCGLYMLVTAGMRFFAKPMGGGHRFGWQWFFTVALDFSFFIVLQAQDKGINYTPLLALPVLMSAVLGSRLLALATGSIVTISLIGYTVWESNTALWSGSHALVQAGLLGAGLLLLALLTNQLAIRLAKEETTSRLSMAQARVQTMVSAMVIENLSHGVLVVDKSGAVHMANPAAYEMLGYEMESLPRSFNLQRVPALTQLWHMVRATFKDGGIDREEITIHLEERHSSHLQIKTQRTPVGGGFSASSALCVIFLQDLREMEARLRTEKLASMGRMSAAVAHEIRNPLAAIVQANALLSEDSQDAMQQRLTGMIGQNASRLEHIVNDILNVARVQEDKCEKGQDDDFCAGGGYSLDLDEWVRVFCEEWIGQNSAADKVYLELDSGGAHVQFSKEHLRRILVNLLDNAARYASGDKASICVQTKATRHAPAILKIWSDGQPIDAGVQRHLFEPFFSSESRSSGLGLYMCRELCQRYGANIGYERENFFVKANNDGGRMGNEFFVSFRRAPSPNSMI